MDTLMAIFQWLMAHQPPFPWSFILGVISFVLTLSFIRGLLEGDDDWTVGPVVLSFLYVIFVGLIGGLIEGSRDVAGNKVEGFYWYHWISMLLGWFGVPAILAALGFTIAGIVTGIRASGKAIARSWQSVVTNWRAWHKRRAAEAEAKRQAAERAPKYIIAKCEALVEQYRSVLPKDLSAPEMMRRAGDLVEALKQLYALDVDLARLVPSDKAGLAEKMQVADKIFEEVCLDQECPELVASLRRKRQSIEPFRRKIHTAIEALVLLISALPEQAADRVALQVPHEYEQVMNDLRQSNGRSLLPSLSSEEEVVSVLPKTRKQTA